MKNKFLLGVFAAALFIITGCTGLDSLGGSSSTKSPMSQERIADSVDINEEIFGIGSAAIEESGRGVAKMRASKEARDDIKKKLLVETQTVLNAYLIEIDFYSKKISDRVMSDLSEYITDSMLSDTVEKDSWVENERIYTVIAIEKSEVPLRSRDTFVFHIESIIKKLTDLKAQIMEIPLEDVSTPAPTLTADEAPTEVTEAPVEVEEVPAEVTETPQEVEVIDTDEDVIDIQL